ncbi:MAG: hypothetical protein J6Y36_04065 [Treponema sp.]|uniref:hypothetical protein n=1 Tax=Treponema sp. TaxID=166 RepID=UPI001B754A9D|nr:hypothetical protein [Treponema sp.]MBP5402318.1 hypothetical protein [Treponema sp.]MBR5933183.1 hypothetical protein [Treponema sp.]
MVGISLKKKVIAVCSVVFFMCGVLSSCGLDTFYVIYPPTHVTHSPALINDDGSNNYVEFYTNENQAQLPSDFYFAGTSVYYKIYSDSSKMEQFKSQIDSLNNSSNYSSAADKIFSTGYTILKYAASGDAHAKELTIAPIGSSQLVYIRLSDYNEISDLNPTEIFKDHISISGTTIGSPRRSVGDTLTFNFGRSNRSEFSATCRIPNSGEADYADSSTSAELYYIDLYALASGHDTTFTPYYSKVLHLGYLKVRVPSETNW